MAKTMKETDYQYHVVANTESGPLVTAKFTFESDAKRFIMAMDMPEGYHTIINTESPKAQGKLTLANHSEEIESPMKDYRD